MAKNSIVTLEVVLNRFIEEGAIPLFSEYVNARQKLPFICKCGGRHSISWDKLYKRSIHCRSCAYPSGAGAHHFKHGLSKELHGGRPPRIRLWYQAVLKRDNFTCVISGSKGNCSAHHLYSFSSYPDLQFELSNGITLSKGLHDEFHAVYGYGNNTLEQFSAFYHTKTGNTFVWDVQRGCGDFVEVTPIFTWDKARIDSVALAAGLKVSYVEINERSRQVITKFYLHAPCQNCEAPIRVSLVSVIKAVREGRT